MPSKIDRIRAERLDLTQAVLNHRRWWLDSGSPDPDQVWRIAGCPHFREVGEGWALDDPRVSSVMRRRLLAGREVDRSLDFLLYSLGASLGASSGRPFYYALDHLTDALIERRAALEAKELHRSPAPSRSTARWVLARLRSPGALHWLGREVEPVAMAGEMAKHQLEGPEGGVDPLDEVQRRQVAEDAFRELLDSGAERAYVVFSNLNQPHEHVRFLFEYGLFAGEVCSREWGTDPRPLLPEAVERLATLGFVRSTRFRLNFGKPGLSPDARALAELLETLFREAYETPPTFPLGTRIELHSTPDAPGANPDRLGWTDAVP
jgi:hypothetical protein